MRRITLAVTAACGLAVAACSDGGSGTGPDGRSQVSLSLVTEPPAAPGLSLDQTVTVGEDVLVLSTAQLVLKEIEFERAESSSDCSDDLPDGDDDCEELEVGPILVDLPLIGGLFGFKSTTENRRDLLILVTPHIIDDVPDPGSRN